MQLWRISNYIDLSGFGAVKFSGRWHTKGRPLLYSAEHPALALVETLVHFSWDTMPVNIQLLTLEITDPEAVETVTPPPDWIVSIDKTRAIGDDWLRSNNSLMLRVPSVILPDSFNYLINPLHPQLNQLKLIKAEKIPLDPRLRRT